MPSAVHRYSVRRRLAVSVKVSTFSGVQSPKPKLCATMRVPGLSARVRIGRSFRFDADEQIGGHHRGRRHVGRERVLELEGHQVRDALAPGVGVGLGDALRIDVHADAARAVDLGGRDRNASVAAARGRSPRRAFVTLASVSMRSTTSCGVGTYGARLGASGRLAGWAVCPAAADDARRLELSRDGRTSARRRRMAPRIPRFPAG